jgi:hypothetical protein
MREKKSITLSEQAFDLIVVLLNKICMVGAALATATVSSGRSMLAHQWLLARLQLLKSTIPKVFFIST